MRVRPWWTSPALIVALVFGVALLIDAATWTVLQVAPLAPEPAEASTSRAKQPDGKEQAAKKRSDKDGAASVELGQRSIQTAAAAALPPPAAAPAPDIAAKLKASGAGLCAAAINRSAASTMHGVTAFDVASHWTTAAPDRRAVSVLIGQKFNETSGVPFGATGIFAAPNGAGSCDSVSVQIVPSPLSCARIQEAMSARGRKIGDLAGLPLMEDAGGQTLLVPTAANTCVLLGMASSYAAMN